MDHESEFSFRCQVALGGDVPGTERPAPAQVRVSGPRGAILGSVAAGFAELHGLRAGPSLSLSCDGTPLADDAVLGRPPLLEGCVITLREGPGTPQHRSEHRSEHRAGGSGQGPVRLVQIAAGPDAGQAVPLGAGEVVVGRGVGAGLVLGDPDVSRRHAAIRPAPASAGEAGGVLGYVRDLGSTNGTVVDGPEGSASVGPVEVPLRDGDRVAIGNTRIVVRRRDRDPAVTAPDGAGHLLISRSAHLREPLADPVVRFPAESADPPNPRFPWLQIALPLVVAVPMAMVWHQPLLVFVALASPVFFLAQFLVERRARQRKAVSDRDSHAASRDEARQRVAALIESEARDLDDWHPDLATLGLIAGSRAAGGGGGEPRRELWLRTPAADGWLSVRLGCGRRPSRVRVEPPDAQQQPWLEGAPISLDLASSPVLGIAGPTDSVRGLARAVVAQLATLCSPDDLRIELADMCGAEGTTAAWTWATHLPHHAVGEVEPTGGDGRARLVVVDALGASRESSGVHAVPPNRTTGRTRGVVVFLHLGSTAAELPIDCHATVLIQDRGCAAQLSRAGAGSVSGWCPDGLGQDAADAMASALAPYRDQARATRTLPDRVHLVDLLRREGTDPLDPRGVTESWERDDGSCVVPIGSGPDAAWRVDLDRDGPHLLVAGTTGAGKSQLLVSLVAGLAATHPPEAVTFVLVDYKGGAAFSDVRALPHVTGLVTDLDPHLTRRLLASLGAEVRRRERLLSAHGAADLGEYRRIRPPTAEALPRLVVIVDEFRVLVEELPDFIPGLVRLAAVGRSLGVHLVLATQRPAGVISADIRANVNLRIALRVRDAADSHDVVECADAAELSPHLPGRAVVALPARTPRRVQVATALGTPRAAGPARPVVERLDRPTEAEAGRAGRRAADPPAVPEADGSSLPAIVTAVQQAWRDRGAARPRAPWLPALPTSLPLRTLREVAERNAPAGRLVLGSQDRVADQSQPPWLWDPSVPGHLALVGSAGSGRTTALRTLVLAAGITGHRVHVLDAGGGLGELGSLPHVGNVVLAGDVERCGRLFTALEHEAQDAALGQEGQPRRESLLLVDGWEAVLAAWSEPEFLALADRLLTVLRDARPGRVRVVAAGGRGLLTGHAGASFTERLLLPLSDPADAALAGVPSTLAATLTTPGRGLHVARGVTTPVQVALPRACDAEFLLSRAPGPAAVSRPWRVPALPDRVGLGRVLALPELEETRPGTGVSAPGRPVIGCMPGPAADPRGTLVRARLPVARNGGSLVLGRPGGGRTTTLDVIEASLRGCGATVARITAHSSASELSALAELLGESPETSVLVDDAEVLGAAGEDEFLVAHLHRTLADARADAAGVAPWPRVIAATTAADAANRYRGLLAELKAGRCGIVVGGVQPGDGEIFGVRLAAGRATLPGRGVLMDRGRAATVQVAHLAPEPSGTADRSARGGGDAATGPGIARPSGRGEDHADHEFGAGPRRAGRILREVPIG